MSRIPNRMYIYAKDIENITGRKKTWVNKIMNNIRAIHHKNKKDLITFREFCDYMKIKKEEEAEAVRKYLVD